MQKNTLRKNQPAPWLFLFGVLAWTWLFLGLVALTGQPLFSFPFVILALLGGLGPVFVPALLIRAGYWDPQLDQNAGAFFKRSFDPRTLPWRWYLVVIGLVLVLAVGPVLLDAEVVRSEGLIAVGPPLTLLVGLIFGALEEPGWRGYAQEGLQRRMPVLAASLVIGVFWALWHLPLFFIAGTYQAGLGIGTWAFWSFNLALVVGSPVYAWLYNAPGRIIFAPLLYHGLGNVARELVPDVANVAEVGVEAVLALGVILLAGSWFWKKRPLPSQMGIMDNLKAEFNRWQGMMTGLDETDADQRISGTGWTVKDVVAHLKAWQDVSRARLQAALDGREPQFPNWLRDSEPEDEGQIDRFNARIYQLFQAKSWSEVYQAWCDGFSKLIEMAAEIPEDDMFNADKYPWLMGYPLIAVLEGTLEHHQEHRPQLRAALKGIAGDNLN